MKNYKKKQLLRLRIALIFESHRRTKYIVKHHVFKQVGENFFFQPRMIPSDPEMIKFHNNVTVASNVSFITHDIMHNMFNHLDQGNFDYYCGCIEIMDNVFIGSNTTILPNVKIGPNAIIAAGSVITKDVEENTVVAGVPAKVIGSFDDYIHKRKQWELKSPDEIWNIFEQEKQGKK